ncbi:MAG: hypothetical protein A2234_00135 [Elusimicrobia bacterium RIFOXYA2_FULL_58_8]|nr:MAG: hypothetical protein A2234_00135 [Elusimicrobia bacterium RIFOXYA2_FULL_58_8]
MKKNTCFALAAAALLAGLICRAPARCEDEAPANALLLMPSEKTAFDPRFQEFLNKNGARLTTAFPPSAFIGHVPRGLDAQLGKKYAVRVYRDKVDDMADFFKCGEKAVLAGNFWNKRFQEDPPAAPVIISHKVNQAGDEKLILRWNEIMRAVAYRLQISRDDTFARMELETVLAQNSFQLYTPFWADGVYYWRVAGRLTLNTGRFKEGAFSEAYSFSVARPPAPVNTHAPALPAAASFRRGALNWPRDPRFRYYRLQVARTRDFTAPLVDVFADTETFKTGGLPLERDTPYYMRLMGADDAGPGAWSKPSRIIIEAPVPAAKGAKKRRRG